MRRRRQRGSAFVLTLVVLAALVGLVVALASTNRAATGGQRNRIEFRRAHLMAEAGIQRAIAELRTQNLDRAYAGDGWAKLGDDGGTQFRVGQDGFRLQILDLGSRIDLNTVDEKQLGALPLSDIEKDSLLDWRENKPNSRPFGAKDNYYNRLPNGYNAKLAPFESVDELLLVRGFTPESLYTTQGRSQLDRKPVLSELFCADAQSADKNTEGKAKLDANTADANAFAAIGIPQGLAQAIVQARSGSFTGVGDVLKVPQMTRDAAQAIADNVTVGTDASAKGKINVNTASQTVLETLPGISPDIASSIVSRQSSGFKSLGELLDVPGIEIPVLAGVIDRLCVSSRRFIVRVVGSAGHARAALEADLSLDDKGNVQVVHLRTPDVWTAPTRWGWQQRTTGQVELGVTTS